MGLCRACLGVCHLSWHLGCHAACHCAPLLLLVQGLEWICSLLDTSALLSLFSRDLQGTPRPAQSRGLLKQSPMERSSKHHVQTGKGPAQVQRSLAPFQCLACSPGPRMDLCTHRTAGGAAPGQGRRHRRGLAAGRVLQADSGTGSHTGKAGLHHGRLIGVWRKTSC